MIQIRTNDVRSTLATVLTSLEANEASEETKEAVLACASSTETVSLVALALLSLLRALGRAHRICKAKHSSASCSNSAIEQRRCRPSPVPGGPRQAWTLGGGAKPPSDADDQELVPLVRLREAVQHSTRHSLIWTAWGWVVVVIVDLGASMAIAGECVRMR